MNISEIGNTVKARRKKLHLCQQELADLAEVNINTILAIERGDGNPKAETLITVANVLGLELILKLKD